MKFLPLLLLVIGCASQGVGRVPASSDPTMDLIKHLTREKEDTSPKYCHGNPPGQDDAWCAWVCIDGKWSQMCR